MAIETTLVLLKPDCVSKNLSAEVLSRFLNSALEIRAVKMMHLGHALLEQHYAHVAQEPFFPEIVAFMQSSPVIAVALKGEDAIAKVRKLIGPTDSTKAPAGTIRGDLGENMMINVCHASDSAESAKVELERFFEADEIFDF